MCRMKELYQEKLDEKYYIEENGGHFFLHGLKFQVMLENEEVAYLFCDYLQREYGLDELDFNTRATLNNKVKDLDRKFGWEKLKNEIGIIECIKILNDLRA